jgi:DNA-binding GntR family transcriptional regulator
MPLYMGLALRLSEGLQRGQWPAEGALPSERVLAELLAVSRQTARDTLGLLCKRGLLVRMRGPGTYRNAPAGQGDCGRCLAVWAAPASCVLRHAAGD